MRVTLSYQNFKLRLTTGTNVYYCDNPGSFVAMYISNSMPCMFVDASKPSSFDSDFVGAMPVVTFAE